MKRSTHSVQSVDQSVLSPQSTKSPIRKYIPIIAAAITVLGLLFVVALLSSRWFPLDEGSLFDSPRHEIALLVIFAALVLCALTAGVALAVISRRMPARSISLTNPVERSESGVPVSHRTRVPPSDVTLSGKYEGKCLLKLNRSTERLASVEQDLIRRISENYDVDRRTYRLMTEIQICTNRILNQLREIECVESVVSEDSSNVKLDDVTVS